MKFNNYIDNTNSIYQIDSICILMVRDIKNSYDTDNENLISLTLRQEYI
jgi:hypothetical protein